MFSSQFNIKVKNKTKQNTKLKNVSQEEKTAFQQALLSTQLEAVKDSAGFFEFPCCLKELFKNERFPETAVFLSKEEDGSNSPQEMAQQHLIQWRCIHM